MTRILMVAEAVFILGVACVGLLVLPFLFAYDLMRGRKWVRENRGGYYDHPEAS